MYKIAKVTGLFFLVCVGLVALGALILMIIYGGPYFAKYLAALLGLGALTELVITAFIYMLLPAAMITHTLIDLKKE